MKYSRILMNRGDDLYPTEVKAEVIALVCDTGNFNEAAREMANNYHEPYPSPKLIGFWLKTQGPENFGALSE